MLNLAHGIRLNRPVWRPHPAVWYILTFCGSTYINGCSSCRVCCRWSETCLLEWTSNVRDVHLRHASY